MTVSFIGGPFDGDQVTARGWMPYRVALREPQPLGPEASEAITGIAKEVMSGRYELRTFRDVLAYVWQVVR